MPREKEMFRDNLERLDAAFPGQEMIRKGELAKWLGISARTLARIYDLGGGQYVTKVRAAREMSA